MKLLTLLILISTLSYSASVTITASPYNADPTGSVDSWSSFNNALADADIVVVPSGTFKLTQALVIPDNKTIKGIGTLLFQMNSQSAISLGDNCTLSGITINSKDSIDHLINFSYVNFIRLNSLYIKNARQYGIFGHHCDSITIDSCIIDNIGGKKMVIDGELVNTHTAGIDLEQKTTRLKITNCTVTNCGQDGIRVWGAFTPRGGKMQRLSKDIYISSNYVANQEEYYLKGCCIWVSGCENVVISNNIAKNSDDYNIGCELSKNVTIENNFCFGSHIAGVKIMNGDKPHEHPEYAFNEDILISNNIIFNYSSIVRAGNMIASIKLRGYKNTNISVIDNKTFEVSNLQSENIWREHFDSTGAGIDMLTKENNVSTTYQRPGPSFRTEGVINDFYSTTLFGNQSKKTGFVKTYIVSD